MTQRPMARRGFTLIEILMAMVLLGIVGLGISRLLTSQMRFFTRSTNMRDARSVSRNALNVVRSEMRMIEPLGITAASNTSITVNVPYAMGVTCSANSGTFVPVDSLISATAVFAGYATRDTALNAQYSYVASGTAPVAGSAGDCTGVGITAIGPILSLSPALPVLPVGSPVLLYQTVTYSIGASTLVPGRDALWRTVTGGASEEVAAPISSASTINFYVSGATTSTATVPGTLSTITGIELVLVGQSERASPGTNTPESQSARVSIFFRNAVQ